MTTILHCFLGLPHFHSLTRPSGRPAMGSTIDEENCIAELFYYHGFLPREDVSHLLKKSGDFLIRCSEVEHGSKEIREYVLSVYVARSVRDERGVGEAISGGPGLSKAATVTQECPAAECGGVIGMSGESLENEKPKKEETMPSSVPVKVNKAKETKESKMEGKIRNLVIRRNGTKFLMRPDQQFDGLALMVEHYKQNEMHLPNVGVVNLIMPIGRAEWEFPHSDIEIGKILGKGAFGEVRAAKLKMADKKVVDVAVKITKGKCELSKAKRAEMMKEARLMRNLVHENVVRMYGVAVLQQPIYILLELINGDSLDVFIKTNKGKIEVPEKMNMLLQAAMGIAFVHKNDLIHRDLAARNCLYSKTKVLKISDFGLSRVGKKYKLTKAARVPIKWLAPETIQKMTFTKKSDIYSYGVIAFEIFNEKDPWSGKNNAEAKKLITSGELLALSDSCPAPIAKYIKEGIWNLDPEQRPNAKKIVHFLETTIPTIPPAPPKEKTMAIEPPPKEEAEPQQPSPDIKPEDERQLDPKDNEVEDSDKNGKKDDGADNESKESQTKGRPGDSPAGGTDAVNNSNSSKQHKNAVATLVPRSKDGGKEMNSFDKMKIVPSVKQYPNTGKKRTKDYDKLEKSLEREKTDRKKMLATSKYDKLSGKISKRKSKPPPKSGRTSSDTGCSGRNKRKSNGDGVKTASMKKSLKKL